MINSSNNQSVADRGNVGDQVFGPGSIYENSFYSPRCILKLKKTETMYD